MYTTIMMRNDAVDHAMCDAMRCTPRRLTTSQGDDLDYAVNTRKLICFFFAPYCFRHIHPYILGLTNR